MKRLSICLMGAALLSVAAAAHAQVPPAAPDSAATPAVAPTTPPPAATPAPPPPPPPAPASSASSGVENPIYYGGAIGFSFWSDYFRISLEPLVGYKLNPKLSVGGKLRYEYINDSRGFVDYDSHNFGAGAFSNYRLIPQLYAHGEADIMSYDYAGGREVVPFILLGGGVSQLMRPNVWMNFEVLWDVLNDKNSPYEEWQPIVSVGVGVGF